MTTKKDKLYEILEEDHLVTVKNIANALKRKNFSVHVLDSSIREYADDENVDRALYIEAYHTLEGEIPTKEKLESDFKRAIIDDCKLPAEYFQGEGRSYFGLNNPSLILRLSETDLMAVRHDEYTEL